MTGRLNEMLTVEMCCKMCCKWIENRVGCGFGGVGVWHGYCFVCSAIVLHVLLSVEANVL